MVVRVTAPGRRYAQDDLALLKGQSPLYTPYENQARALRRAAQAARENRPTQDTPRFLNAKQWENHPQANGQPRPRPDDVVTERQRRQLGLPTLRMNAELRKQKNTIASAYRKQAQETVRGLARMQQNGFTVTSRLMRGDPAGVGPGAKKMEEGLKWYEKGVISTTVNQVVAEKYASTYHDDDTYKSNPPYISYFPRVRGGADIQNMHPSKAMAQEVLLPAGTAFETILYGVDSQNFLVQKVVHHAMDLPAHAGVGDDPHLIPAAPVESLKQLAQTLWSPPAPLHDAAVAQALALNLTLALHVVSPDVIRQTLLGYTADTDSGMRLRAAFSRESAHLPSTRVIPILKHYGGALSPDAEQALRLQLDCVVFRPVTAAPGNYRKAYQTLMALGAAYAGATRDQREIQEKGLPVGGLEAIALHDKHLPAAFPESIREVMLRHFAEELFNNHSRRFYIPDSLSRDKGDGVAVPRLHEILGILNDFETLAQEVVGELRRAGQHGRRAPRPMAAQPQPHQSCKQSLKAALERMSDHEYARFEAHLASADGPFAMMRKSMANDLNKAVSPTPVMPQRVLDAYRNVLNTHGRRVTLRAGDEDQLLKDLAKAIQPLTPNKLLQMIAAHIPRAQIPALNAELNDRLQRPKLQLLQRQLDQLPVAAQDDVLASLEQELARAGGEDGQVTAAVRALIDRYREPAVEPEDPQLTKWRAHAASLDDVLRLLPLSQRQPGQRSAAEALLLKQALAQGRAGVDAQQLKKERLREKSLLQGALEAASTSVRAEDLRRELRMLADRLKERADGKNAGLGLDALPTELRDRLAALVNKLKSERDALTRRLKVPGARRTLQKFLNFPDTMRSLNPRTAQDLPLVMVELGRYLQALPATREAERDQAATLLATILAQPMLPALQHDARALLMTLVDLPDTDDPSPARLKRFAKYFGTVFGATDRADQRLAMRFSNTLHGGSASEKRQLALLAQLGKQIGFLAPADRTAILLDLLETQKAQPRRRAAELGSGASVGKAIARLVKMQCFEGWGKEGFDSAALFHQFVAVMPDAAAAAFINRNDVEGTYLRLVREFLAHPGSALPREQRIALLPALIAVAGELSARLGPMRSPVQRLTFDKIHRTVLGSIVAVGGPVAALALGFTVPGGAALAAVIGLANLGLAYATAKNVRPAARKEIADCLDGYLALKDLPEGAGPSERAAAALPLAPVWIGVLDRLVQDPAMVAPARKGILNGRRRQDRQLGYFLAQSDIEQYRHLSDHSANESMRQAINAWAPALASLVPLLPALKTKPHAGERLSVQEQAIANLDTLLAACRVVRDDALRADALLATVPIVDALSKVVNKLSNAPRSDGGPSPRQWAQATLDDYDNQAEALAPAWATVLDELRASRAASSGNQVPDAKVRDNQQRWISRFLEQSERELDRPVRNPSGPVEAWAPAIASLIPLLPQLNTEALSDTQPSPQARAIATIEKFIDAADALPAIQRQAVLPARAPITRALEALVDQFGLVEELDGPARAAKRSIATWARETLQRAVPDVWPRTRLAPLGGANVDAYLGWLRADASQRARGRAAPTDAAAIRTTKTPRTVTVASGATPIRPVATPGSVATASPGPRHMPAAARAAPPVILLAEDLENSDVYNVLRHFGAFGAEVRPAAPDNGKQRTAVPQSTPPAAAAKATLARAEKAYDKILREYQTTQRGSHSGAALAPVVAVPVPTGRPAPQSAQQIAQFQAFRADADKKTAENDARLKAWFTQQGITRAINSGSGNNCLIMAAAQHASGVYTADPDPRVVAEVRRKLLAKFPALGEFDEINAFSDVTQHLVKLINATYGVNLRLAFVQSSEGGKPYVTLTPTELVDPTVVPVWHSVNHYEAMTLGAPAASASAAKRSEV